MRKMDDIEKTIAWVLIAFIVIGLCVIIWMAKTNIQER